MKVIIFICFFIFSCTQPSRAGTNNYGIRTYFPTSIGSTWTYYDSKNVMKTTVEIIGYDEKNDAYQFFETTEFPGIGTTLHLKLIKVDNELVQIIADRSKAPFDNQPSNWKEYSGNIALKSPYTKGSKWVSKQSDSFIEHEVLGIVNAKVGAGNFSNVLLTKDVGKYVDGQGNYKVFATTFSYYAPKVGLIKIEVEGANGKAIFKELQEYSIK